MIEIVPTDRATYKNKILFITLLLPYPPNSGSAIHFFPHIKTLASRSDITLICFVDDEEQLRYIDNLKPYCSSIFTIVKKIRTHKHKAAAFWNFSRSTLTLAPYQVKKCFSKEMQQKINQLLYNNNYDAVFVVDIGMAQYIKGYNQTPKVLFKTYIESLFYKEYAKCTGNILMRYLAILEAQKLKRYERIILKEFDKIVTVTEKDAEYLSGNTESPLSFVRIPIGIDTNFFTPSDLEPKAKTILLLGSLFWYPNLDQARWFLRKIFPGVKKQIPEVKLIIIGEGAPKDILTYANKWGISFVGPADDIRPYFKNATLMVVPVRICGGGVRTKILTALAAKVPVVSTRIGYDGLGLTAEKEIIIADAEEDFTHAVVRVLNDADLRKRLANNGHSFILENFSMQRVSENLQDLLDNLAPTLK